MNKPQPAANLHVFRAGTHTATDGKQYIFSEADVADMVASYDPALSRAPLVVGHPKTDDPAYGWAAGFSCTGGEVFATPEAVHSEFAEMVNDGRFGAISLSMYLPDTPGNPKPGHHYPRHIGFLGAQPPAVKGLQRPQFAEGDGAIEFSMPLPRRITSLGYYLKRLFQGLRDRAIESDGAEKAEQLIPQWCIDGIAEATDDDDQANAAFAEATHTTESTMSQSQGGNPADFAEQQRQLDTRNAELEQREKALQDRETAARRADVADFAEQLVQSGKVLPRQQAGVIELLLAFPAGTVLNFAEADGQAATDHEAGELLRTFLDELPARVDFAEKSGAHHNGTANTADFAAPAGMQVDASRMELHSKALDYQRQHPGTDYMTAVKAAGG
ncbi:MAG: hypothetical protein WA956_05615 [Stenotrophomonas sp.]